MKFQLILTTMILLAPIMAASHEKSAGIAPDSILWGLDVAIDKISLALTRNPDKRAEKALEIAQERLMEVKAMTEANKFEAAARAENEHNSTMKEVEDSINKIFDDDPKKQIERELELETKLKAYQETVKRVKTELRVKIQIEGELTAEQQTRLDEFLTSLGESTDNARIQVQKKKDRTKITIREKTGETEEEVEQEIERQEIERGLLDEHVEVQGRVFGNKTYVKIEFEYDSNKTVREEVLAEFLEKFYLDTNKADTLLKMRNGDEASKDKFKIKVKIDNEGSEVGARLSFVVNATQRDQVVDAIVNKTKMELSDIQDALKIKEKKEDKENDEIEIEVEIQKDVTRVKIKFGGEKTRFELNTTNQTEIISAIAAQLGLSVEEIKKFTKFEDERENDENEDTDRLEDHNENKTKEKDDETDRIEDADKKLEDNQNKTEEKDDTNKLENKTGDKKEKTEENAEKTEDNKDSDQKNITISDGSNSSTDGNTTSNI